MRIDNLYMAAKRFVDVVPISMSIGDLVSTGPISDPSNVDLRERGMSASSGIYFIVRPDGDVTYIGKATKGNLHPELWGKLRTPVGESTPFSYPNTYWSNMRLNEKVALELREGRVTVAAFEVSPDFVCSLLEVYLQTLVMSADETLPCMNSQIG